MTDSKNQRSSISENFIPNIYKTAANKKFLQSTIDNMVQPGTVKKVDGYIGRQNSKTTGGDDVFIAAATPTRQNYQLEPGFTIKDTNGNTTFFKDYQDYINQLAIFNANTSNHARLNKQEFYSWDPHIDWDKFVNFQNYYWLPYGPEIITVRGQKEKTVSVFTVTLDETTITPAYVFTPNGVTKNPFIKLYRGQTYRFEVSAVGNPFCIKTRRTPGIIDTVTQIVEDGVIELTLGYDSPDVLYYQSTVNIDVGGVIHIHDIVENTSLDVKNEIIGKSAYTTHDGITLSNGMKISFGGNIIPAEYSTGQYYVEGVGTAIVLIPERDTEVICDYTTSQNIPFDTTPFDNTPFNDATAYANKQDYIVINRASIDKNPWARLNRWFHKDIIEKTASINDNVVTIDNLLRATRPIIEFEASLKLYNFGTIAGNDVDLIDTFTTDVFSIIEGATGYNIDGIELVHGQRILFTADTDVLVKNNVYKVEFIDLTQTSINGKLQKQIRLVKENFPVVNQSVLIRDGIHNKGTMYWFNGESWIKAQEKTSINQAPLFDIVGFDKISFGDSNTYIGTTFSGTKLFSYKVGSGIDDKTLGFPLSYKNINNIGDIVFNFNILFDSFDYKRNKNVINKIINDGYLVKTHANGDTAYVNGWQKNISHTTQAAVRIYKNSGLTDKFRLDIYDDIDDLKDLILRVYKNGIRLDTSEWTYESNGRIILDNKLVTFAESDVLTIRAFAKQPINKNGFYEPPLNLQNNPLNEEIYEFTLGEVIDHVNTIVDNLISFTGKYPGVSNLRDLGNTAPYGTRFVQHSGPASLSTYHIASSEHNIIRAIEKSRADYDKFKRKFLSVAASLGVHAEPRQHVDLILQDMNKNSPKSSPYYFSDMVPYGANIKTDFTVFDYRIKKYPLSEIFNLTELSNKAVLVYLNNQQLLHEHQYEFDADGFVVISADMSDGDIISVYEYENTNGCFIPETPSKLGILPTYDPLIYDDTSFIYHRRIIQGHDGSQILAYGDYRDDLILELEKRIYNNIKVSYDPSIFDITDFIPSFNRKTDYSLQEFNNILSSNFYSWMQNIGRDYKKQHGYDKQHSITYNYDGYKTFDKTSIVPGYWRGIYRWMLDTDQPGIRPWEMLGFSDEPQWWKSAYGPAPYTSNNLVMWEDIRNGLVKEPGKKIITLPKYKKLFLLDYIPVDENGVIRSPLETGIVTGNYSQVSSSEYVFGDVGPVEAAWRRSSHYSFSVVLTLILMNPSKVFGLIFDRSRIVRNLAGQLVYKDTGVRMKPSDVKIPSVYANGASIKTSGIINYLVNYISGDNVTTYNKYKFNLSNITAKLSYRVGAFTSKEKFNLILDSKNPMATSGIFVPQENYDIILNSSSSVKKLTYSGIIITKLDSGYEITGYSKKQPYFNYYKFNPGGSTITVGGISESYSTWGPTNEYVVGKIVLYYGRFYRVIESHTSGEEFDPLRYVALPSLPSIGGCDAVIKTKVDKREVFVLPYGTVLGGVQEVVDFMLGYSEYLQDVGFIFDEFRTTVSHVANWLTSVNEFMFWTLQNWAVSGENWTLWKPYTDYSFGELVVFSGEYYKARMSFTGTAQFDFHLFEKVGGRSIIGSSVLSLSPCAYGIKFKTDLSSVEDIRNQFNEYELVDVNGISISDEFMNSYVENNIVSYTATNGDGIFGASFYLVQKEHVVIFDNNTIFNDTIYNPVSGYKQERIKLSGYVSMNWNGTFSIPGFIFDQAYIQEWVAWQNYAMGDVVKYKEYYYSANKFNPGTETFDDARWVRLTKKPEPSLLPNWSYKASQFEDFYSLDSDNFDIGQQKMAQHLVGYQKRQYLENIIQNDVSEFKFYQGMLPEKGTANVLNKLFDVLSSDGQESLRFYEEWALRLGQYGASSAYENIEFVLQEDKFKINPQGIQLANVTGNTPFDFIIRQSESDVYLKPPAYNSNPWPVTTKNQTLLRTPGYVRTMDVQFVISSMDELLSKNISEFSLGDYIWNTFGGTPWDPVSWDVYQLVNANIDVLNVTSSGTTIKIITTKLVDLQVGDYIGINNISLFSGFYKISDINLTSIIIKAAIDITIFNEQSKIIIYKLVSKRTKTIDDIDLNYSRTMPGDMRWIDNTGSNKWGVIEYNPVYKKDTIKNVNQIYNLGFGTRVALNDNANIAAVATASHEIILNLKSGIRNQWSRSQLLTQPYISEDMMGVYYTEETTNLISVETVEPLSVGEMISFSNSIGGLDNKSSYYILSIDKYSNKITVSDSFSGSAKKLQSSVVILKTTSTVNTIHIANAAIFQVGQEVRFANSVGGLISDTRYYIAAIVNTTTIKVSLTVNGGEVQLTTATGSITLTYSIVSTISDMVFSGDSKWVAIGYSSASYSNNSYLGEYNTDYSYAARSVVSYNNRLYTALGEIGMHHEPDAYNSEWMEISLLEVAPQLKPSNLLNHGVVAIYEQDSKTKLYSLLHVVMSPRPCANENFGHSIAFRNDTLYVGAPGSSDNSGRVYKIDFNPIINATSYYNPNGSAGTTLVISSALGIEVGDIIVGAGFNGHSVMRIIDAATIELSAKPDYTPSGKIQFIKYAWQYDYLQVLVGSENSKFGTELHFSNDNSTLVIAAPNTTSIGGVVKVYSVSDDSIILRSTIAEQTIADGNSISISGDGEFVAISDAVYSMNVPDQNINLVEVGKVSIYSKDGELTSTLVNILPESMQHFGSKVFFMNGSNTLVVYSENSDSKQSLSFNDNTTFDNKTTLFVTKQPNSGRVDIYDRYLTNWVFGESLEVECHDAEYYGKSVAVSRNTILVGAPFGIDQSVISGKVYEYTKLSLNSYSWTMKHTEVPRPDVTKIKQAFLYNKNSNKLITYLDIIDPIQGKIAGVVEEEIDYKTFYDPAIYSKGTDGVTVDDGLAWTKSYVGRVWWDLRTAKFVNSYDDNILYRTNTWNTLAYGASIDIYEWVETTTLPSLWDKLADTEEGLVNNISGMTLYGDKSYSIVRKYDNISQTFKNTYYFWVKNKKTIPNVAGRRISSYDASSIIANPRGVGRQYLALTGTNSFSLTNIKPLLNDNDVVLSVEYWTGDKTDQNIHTEWKIISSDTTTIIPSRIEEKWVDSLCGKDESNRLVPDMGVPPKLRYGIEAIPRQSMFVNRFEILKQLIVQTNAVLKANLITDTRDISILSRYDNYPSTTRGLYDSVVDTYEELQLTNITLFKRPVLTPIIVDGRIVDVTIINKGNGYKNVSYIEVVGSGKGAVLKTKINSAGQITGVDVISGGNGYDNNTVLFVRDYSILVYSDSQSGDKWGIYSYDPINKLWSKVKSQSYDVSEYWEYIDWYADDYTKHTKIHHSVDTFADISSKTVKIGELVKVRLTNNGKWVLLVKYSDAISVDWTMSYRVVGSQQGTIQFKSSLYEFSNTGSGYDGILFDSGTYDDNASIELRFIFNVIKNNIFIDNLKHHYLNLFFTSIRYALSEQTYVDWVFKTSFVKAKHNVGELHQPSGYRNDNLQNFEDYVAEVKPYRTQIREYISSYEKLDMGGVSTTDFDVPPLYNRHLLLSVNNSTITHDETLDTYPWRHWADNVGFSVTSITIIDGGSGYINEPIVTIVGASKSTSIAKAYIAHGKVTRIVMVSNGSGYLQAPHVKIEGGLSENGVSATAIATIGDGVVRSNMLKIKFDRITQTYFITQLQETEEFTGTGTRLQFSLTWAPNLILTNTSVIVDGQTVVKSNYKMDIRKSKTRGYTSYYGTITFNSAPAVKSKISVTYVKDWSLLNASDRIQYYYNPTSGELGNDLAQLMSGVDYGGVIVSGLGFAQTGGWDSIPYYSDRWDSKDPTFDDYIVMTSANEHEFTLPYIPTAGTVINVYHNGIKIDDPYYGTESQTNKHARMASWVADGVRHTVTIPNSYSDIDGIIQPIVIKNSDQIILRKITSDGAPNPSEYDYDTTLVGGDLAYQSAVGINADDIIVDGDGFVTPTTSPATEEVVPGQVVDAVAIKVFEKSYSGSASIKIDNFITDGVSKTYTMTHQINNSQAVIVKVSNGTTSTIKEQGVDYIVNLRNNSITFVTPPPINHIVSIYSFGVNGVKILDINSVISTGETTGILTTVSYKTNINAMVYVNGVNVSYTVSKENGFVKINLAIPPANDSLVTYVVFDGELYSFAVTKTENIIADGRPAGVPYNIQSVVGDSLPVESKMLVFVGNKVLKAPVNNYYTIKNSILTYVIDAIKFQPHTVNIEDFEVIVDGNKLKVSSDYTVDLSCISITINKRVYKKYNNKEMIVSITRDNEYFYIPATHTESAKIQFTDQHESGKTISIVSSYKHENIISHETGFNVSDILVDLYSPTYYSYVNIKGGVIPLENAVMDDSYVWVIKNDSLLTSSVDYKLNSDKRSITLGKKSKVNDTFTIITYSNNILKSGISYMQFKDMLNRTHFKRLSLSKQTTLAHDLKWNDTSIIVSDASNFDEPNPLLNRPGIIEIRGERIEYFNKNGNVLSQLRRGTLGTGTPLMHSVGANVQDIGTSETIPYRDHTITEQIVSDGTTIVPLKFIPEKSTNVWDYRSSIPLDYGQCNSIEVFVGGYANNTPWVPNVLYTVGTLVVNGSYTYKCVTEHTSSMMFADDSTKWEFFIGNIRLKKAPYKVHNVGKHMDSPEGDINFDADFAVDGVASEIVLTNKLEAGTHITVVKRTGRAWNVTLDMNSDISEVATFLKTTPGIWYSPY